MDKLNKPASLNQLGDTATMTAEIYTLPVCPWCYKAKKLMQEFGIEYTETPDTHPDHPTVPYIIINGEVIGGYAELREFCAEL